MVQKLVRHHGSGQWLSASGAMTLNRAHAVQLPSMAQAVRLCRERHLTDMELVLHAEDEVEVVIPLEERTLLQF